MLSKIQIFYFVKRILFFYMFPLLQRNTKFYIVYTRVARKCLAARLWAVFDPPSALTRHWLQLPPKMFQGTYCLYRAPG